MCTWVRLHSNNYGYIYALLHIFQAINRCLEPKWAVKYLVIKTDILEHNDSITFNQKCTEFQWGKELKNRDCFPIYCLWVKISCKCPATWNNLSGWGQEERKIFSICWQRMKDKESEDLWMNKEMQWRENKEKLYGGGV